MKPTAERVRSLLVYDPQEVKEPFQWQAWFKIRPWEKITDYSKVGEDGFLAMNIDGTFYRADELAWLSMKGKWPEHEIVHADGKNLNNSWDNIKEKAKLAEAA